MREEEFDQALKIASRLEKLRYSAAFEIGALAHAGQGNLTEAVALLERGVEKAPDVLAELAASRQLPL